MSRKKKGKQKQQRATGQRSDAKTGLLTIAVFAVALHLRLLFLVSNIDKDWPYSIFYYGDSGHYHEYAVSLLRAEHYDNGIPYHPPLYAWVLAALYKIKGIPTQSGYFFKICMAVLNSITIAIAWLWFRKILPPGWNTAATGILIFSFGWLVFSLTFNNEVLYALFLTATVAIVSSMSRQSSWRNVLLLGVMMGLGSLTRAEHLSLWLFMLIYLWWQRNPNLGRTYYFTHWGTAIGVSLLIVLPWSIRNYKILSQFNDRNPDMEPLPVVTTVSAYGPVNFALANNHFSDGGFSPDLINRFTGGSAIDLTLAQHRYYFIHGYEEGLSWILSHKREALNLLAMKLARWSNGLAVGFGVSNWPGGLKGSRPPVDLFVPDNRILEWPFLALLILGFAFSFQKRYRTFSLCSLVLLHRLIVTALFFGYARSMVVMLPVLIPLLLLPLMILAEKKFPVLEKMIPYACGVLGVLLLLESLGTATGSPKNYMSSGSVDEQGKIIQDARVEIWPK